MCGRLLVALSWSRVVEQEVKSTRRRFERRHYRESTRSAKIGSSRGSLSSDACNLSSSCTIDSLIHSMNMTTTNLSAKGWCILRKVAPADLCAQAHAEVSSAEPSFQTRGYNEYSSTSSCVQIAEHVHRVRRKNTSRLRTIVLKST